MTLTRSITLLSSTNLGKESSANLYDLHPAICYSDCRSVRRWFFKSIFFDTKHYLGEISNPTFLKIKEVALLKHISAQFVLPSELPHILIPSLRPSCTMIQ